MRRACCGVLVALLVSVGACGGGSSADPKAFCERLDRLVANDPFLTFGDRATPAEVATAFQALVARADELLDVAPDEARAAARDYADAARALDDLMAGAAYSGDQVDARAYREQQVRYSTAASLLERHLETEC